MECEEALMIEPGKIEDVLGRRHHEPVEVERHHLSADLVQPGLVLLLGERRHLIHRQSSPL